MRANDEVVPVAVHGHLSVTQGRVATHVAATGQRVGQGVVLRVPGQANFPTRENRRVQNHDGGVGHARATGVAQGTGDDTNNGVTLVVGEQPYVEGTNILIARAGHFHGRGKVDPELNAVEETTRINECIWWTFDVQDARTGGHPLRGTVGDHSTATDGVLVEKGPLHHVGNGFEAAVRVPRSPLGFARTVVHLAHLIQVDEGVEIGELDAVKGPTNRKTLTFHPTGCGGDLHDTTRAVAGTYRDDTGEFERVSNGDGRHTSTLTTYSGRTNFETSTSMKIAVASAIKVSPWVTSARM